MAQAYPKFEAGEGDGGGQNGTASEWPYVVEVDNVGDDPWPVLFGVMRLGMPHPDPQFSTLMVAVDYRKVKNLNERWFLFSVIFGPISDQTIGVWHRRGSAGTSTRPLERSLASFDDDGVLADKPLQVGPAKWVLAYDEDGRPLSTPYHTLPDADNPDATSKPLRVSEYVDRGKGGIEVNESIVPLIYDITVPQLTIQQIINLTSYTWLTNKESWPRKSTRYSPAYERWSLIFSTFAWEDRVIALQGAGPFWFSDVSVELLYHPIHPVKNPFGWRGKRRYEYYTDDYGMNAQVYTMQGGKEVPVSKDYVTYDEVAFSSLFAVLGSSPVM